MKMTPHHFASWPKNKIRTFKIFAFRIVKSDSFQSGGGFTLLEVILAITCLTIAVGASFALIQQTLASATVIQSKLIASYLVQSGIEIVKNIRDGNWLEQRVDPFISWDEGLPEGDWEIDFKNQILPYDTHGHFLNIDSDGFYSYSPGPPSHFKRKISISEKIDLNGDKKPDKMKVLVEVQWRERGRIQSIQAMEYLTNWYGY